MINNKTNNLKTKRKQYFKSDSVASDRPSSKIFNKNAKIRISASYNICIIDHCTNQSDTNFEYFKD